MERPPTSELRARLGAATAELPEGEWAWEASASAGRMAAWSLRGAREVRLCVFERAAQASRLEACWGMLRAGGDAPELLPEVLASDASETRGWALVRIASGRPAAAAWDVASPDERVRLARQIGALVGEVQGRVASKRYGEVEASEGGTFLTWSAKLNALLTRHRAQAELLPAGDRRDVIELGLEHLERQLRVFHPRADATLVTRALTLDHVWVNEAGGVLDCVGWLAMDEAVLAPGEYDFAYLFWLDRFEGDARLIGAFYQGYGMARTMDVRRRERVYRTLVALDVLLGSRWVAPEVKAQVEQGSEACLDKLRVWS